MQTIVINKKNMIIYHVFNIYIVENHSRSDILIFGNIQIITYFIYKKIINKNHNKKLTVTAGWDTVIFHMLKHPDELRCQFFQGSR